MTAVQPASRFSSVLVVLALIAVTLSAISPAPASAQESTQNIPTGPGLNWTMPETHMLFVNGTEGQDNPVNLNREYPYFTGEPLFRTFNLGTTTVIEVESEPAVETVVLSGEADVFVYSSLVSDTPSCLLESVVPGAGATSFTVWLDVGTTTVIDGEETDSQVMQDGWEQATEFHVNGTYNNVTLGEGDVVTLTIQVEHSCSSSQGRVYWDAYQSATRVVLRGEMLQPELEVSADANGLVRIEFTPISPWGGDDYSWQFIDIVGPLGGWEEARHLSTKPAEDSHVEHFEIPHGSRLVEANRTALVWISNATLQPGKYMVDSCFILTAGDFNEDCDSEDSDHIVAVYRFEVASQDNAIAGAGWFWLVSISTLIGYLGLRLKSGLMPWPTLVLLLVLALSSMAPAATLPSLEFGATRDDSSAPTFSLLQHPSTGQDAVSLNDLLSGHDAVVLGLFTSGSPNAEQQKRDFDNASERLGDSVAFAQIATGEGVQPTDLDYYADLLNGSWPLLIDESKGEVANQLPSGIADGVIIVDSAGFISTSSSGSMSDQRIVESVEKSMKGSDQSMLNIFYLLIPTLIALPLLILAFPRKRMDVPDTPLPPFAGVGGTVLAASIGFAIWSLPVALLSLVAGGIWSFIELVLVIWLAWQGLSLAIHSEVHEVNFIASEIHKRMPESYRKWRLKPDFTRDVLLGHWLAWLSWLAYPLMIPQGIGSVAAASLTGLVMSPVMLIFHCLVAGFVVLILRALASIGGPFSRLLGILGHDESPRLWGCLLIGMAVWWFVWLLIGPIGNALLT
uniref:Thioredoxin domain-containing protein n=1 Tax=uncultured marine group II/III euryarchaeote KM3_190_A05 TaxID=1457960 RepID=A0A075GQX2_9EURY|nr:hypothetical protein [uncultured marine group II/III euryarchaeote KM3_190_A05]